MSDSLQTIFQEVEHISSTLDGVISSFYEFVDRFYYSLEKYIKENGDFTNDFTEEDFWNEFVNIYTLLDEEKYDSAFDEIENIYHKYL